MDPTPAEPPPGCLVLLLRLSADMTTDVVIGQGETVAFAAARQLRLAGSAIGARSSVWWPR